MGEWDEGVCDVVVSGETIGTLRGTLQKSHQRRKVRGNGQHRNNEERIQPFTQLKLWNDGIEVYQLSSIIRRQIMGDKRVYVP
jgi:hypothetical protein